MRHRPRRETIFVDVCRRRRSLSSVVGHRSSIGDPATVDVPARRVDGLLVHGGLVMWKFRRTVPVMLDGPVAVDRPRMTPWYAGREISHEIPPRDSDAQR